MKVAGFLVLGAVGLASAGGAWVLAGGGGGGSSAETSADVFEVAERSFQVTTVANGELQARRQIEVRNPLRREAVIEKIIDEGTFVSEGEVLIQLNTEELLAKADDERIQVESARAQLTEAQTAYEIQISENDSKERAAKLKLELAELDLAKWKEGEVKSRKQELDHALDRAQKEEERLREKLAKSRELNKEGFYSDDQLKQDKLAWEKALADRKKAELDRKIYWDFEYTRDEKQKNSDVEEARAELDRVRRQNASRLASKRADQLNKQRTLQIREQRLADLVEEIEACTVRAPGSGLVVYSTSMERGRWGNDDPLQVGTRVYPNQQLIFLPDTSEMIAVVRVHEALAGKVVSGQSATLKIDAVGRDRFTGRVESRGVIAEATGGWRDPNLREYSVRIAIDRSEGMSEKLKPSMRAEARLVLEQVEDVLAIPVQSVHNEGVLRYVYVSEGSGFVRRPVRVGRRSDMYAEVIAGLEPGERVLTRNPAVGEVVDQDWDEAELAAVGFRLDKSGKVIRTAGGAGRVGEGDEATGDEQTGGGGGPNRS